MNFKARLFGQCLVIVMVFVYILPGLSCARETNGKAFSEIIILFDPTIFEASEKSSLDTLMDDFSEFFTTIPSNSKVSVWFIDHDILRAKSAYSETFKADNVYGGAQRAEKALADSFKDIRARLEAEWKIAHQPENLDKPVSCIIKSVYKANRLIKNIRDNNNIYLVVISDFLEVCAERYRTVNFESALTEEDSARSQNYDLKSILGEQDYPINLAKATRVLFVRVPEVRITTMHQLEALDNFWNDFVYNQSKLKKSCFIYTEDNFPLEGFF